MSLNVRVMEITLCPKYVSTLLMSFQKIWIEKEINKADERRKGKSTLIHSETERREERRRKKIRRDADAQEK